jgi:fructokinase
MLSEVRFGAAHGFHNAVGIIMGTGFGSGVWLQDRLFVGQSGLAPELGHTILDVYGRLCLCGNRGCVEAYLSGPSILKRYFEAGGNLCQSTEEVFDSAEPLAKTIVEETLNFFDRFMAMLVSVYDPEVIVLGGGLSLQKMYYGREEKIARYVFGSNEMVKIKPAVHGDASGKLGAAALFF